MGPSFGPRIAEGCCRWQFQGKVKFGLWPTERHCKKEKKKTRPYWRSYVQRSEHLTIGARSPDDDSYWTCQTAFMGHTMTMMRDERKCSATRAIDSIARALRCWLEQLDAPQISCEGHHCLGFDWPLCILLGLLHLHNIRAEHLQCPRWADDILAFHKHVCSCSSSRFWHWRHCRPRRCSNIFGRSKQQHKLPSVPSYRRH